MLSEIAGHMGSGQGTTAKMLETRSAMDPELSDEVLAKLGQTRNNVLALYCSSKTRKRLRLRT